MGEGLILGPVVAFLFGLLVGGFAVPKGYNFLIWFLSSGIAVMPPFLLTTSGLVILIWLVAAGVVSAVGLRYLPYTNRGNLTPATAGRWRAAGNAAVFTLALLSFGLGKMLLGGR